jgi:hypothetical protein
MMMLLIKMVIMRKVISYSVKANTCFEYYIIISRVPLHRA